MAWKYILLGLTVGTIVGVIITQHFSNRRARLQQTLQYELKKNRADLYRYRKEIINHFSHTAEALDNMARDYNKLYQYIAKSSNNLLLDTKIENNPSKDGLTESEASNDQSLVQIPHEYLESISDLLRNNKKHI